jgi:hypothetical protein
MIRSFLILALAMVAGPAAAQLQAAHCFIETGCNRPIDVGAYPVDFGPASPFVSTWFDINGGFAGYCGDDFDVYFDWE